ncbi:pyocin activator PrtN family protein [Stenotrophomonas sp. YIM B06876]|uniref:pyocin activator PrtN family protein n=1 Tax=Stenotrophomonas sp. YIM B06876 TaxID=3060211 RepID=UPI002739F469|nr:pyocin activator PrtN family protein [Stenotrophomonas sp. YIM B06876]
MKTLMLLMAEYGTAQIPLAKCAPLFGLTPAEAAKRAIRAALPVPAFRLASQKSPWIIDAPALAAYVDRQREAAELEWKKIQSASASSAHL